MSAGIILRAPDKVAEARAKKLQVGIIEAKDWTLRFDKNLFITPGTCVPWDQVPAGFGFLDKWDAAAPLWRYGAMATDLGTPDERKRTQAITRDLRLLVYSHELLFVRDSELGRALVAAWLGECQGGEPRLAFLRALYLVKPRFCALPRSWLADLEQRSHSDEVALRMQRDSRGGAPLIQVEIAPGRFVRCYADDKEKVLAQYAKNLGGRGYRQARNKK